jgi:hypothetical protein
MLFFFTELSPSWKSANRTDTQEFHNSLEKAKIQFCVHESHLLIHILSQMDPVNTIPTRSPFVLFFELRLGLPSGIPAKTLFE